MNGWHELKVGRDAGGLRLVLDDEPVSMGTGLDLLLQGGATLRVRVEGQHQRPRLYLATGGPWEALEAEPRCDCDRPDFPEDDDAPRRCRSCGRLSDAVSYFPAELVCSPAFGDEDLEVGAVAFSGCRFRWPGGDLAR